MLYDKLGKKVEIRAHTTSVLGFITDVVCLFYFKRAFFFTFLLLRCTRILPGTVPASYPSLFDLHLHLILLHFTSSCSRRRELRFERFCFRFQVRSSSICFEAVPSFFLFHFLLLLLILLVY